MKRQLSDEQAAGILADLALGKKTKQQIANEHNVSRSLIYHMSVGNIYADIARPELVDSDDPDLVENLQGRVAFLKHQVSKNRTIAKKLRRRDGLLAELVTMVDKTIPRLKPLKASKIKTSKARKKQDLVLVLSDGHNDAEVTLEKTGGLEEYNFHVSCNRGENLVKAVQEMVRDQTNYDFQRLHILSLGDSTCGEIHGAVKHSTYGEVLKNSMAIAQLYALMIRDMAPLFKEVTYVGLSGNHGRRTPTKEHHAPQNNFDYLINKFIAAHLSDIKNIEFIIPDSFDYDHLIRGKAFHLAHGDDVRGTGGNPFRAYMTQRRNRIALSPISGRPPAQYHVIGHHHIAASLQDVDGELLVNGAWLGTDPYAYNAFTGYRAPTQLLFSVDDDGIDLRKYVAMRSEDDTTRESRYQIDSEVSAITPQ